MSTSHGYSGTPLAKKLGIKPGYILYVKNAPMAYTSLFTDFPEDVQCIEQPATASVDVVHLFCTTTKELDTFAPDCKKWLKKNGMLWVSWPKGGSKIPTDLKRDPIRNFLLGLGLVDIKVAAVNADWSGLKFVYRTADR